MNNGNIKKSVFTTKNKEFIIHTHCYQKALINSSKTEYILNFPEEYSAKLLDSGCCGMAGSFGYEKEHFDISIKITKQSLEVK